MIHLINDMVHFIAVHSAWTFPVMFITAFGESFVLLSLLFPGTTIMIAAGLLVPSGTIPLMPLLAGGISGAVLGDAVSWWLGKRYGHLLTGRRPFRIRLELLARGEAFFRKYGGASVFIGRFFGPFRAVIPITAGLMRMPAKSFWTANILSALIWAPALILPGSLATIVAGFLGIPRQWQLAGATGVIFLAAMLLWAAKRLGWFKVLREMIGISADRRRYKGVHEEGFSCEGSWNEQAGRLLPAGTGSRRPHEESFQLAMPDHSDPLAETRSPGPTQLVCVGTATRNRPFMLQRLLASYEKLFIPPEIAVRFVIVENNPSPTLEALVENFRIRVPWSVQYEIEPRPGIAFVRNRVLDLALAAGGQFLTFADDDEEVDHKWLAMLLAESDAGDLDIVGSPVRVAPLKDGKGLWPRLLWQGLDQARRGKEKRAAKYRAGGRAAEISVPTGSWLGRLAFFEKTGLRFDERYNLSGNEDGRLWLHARELGARTGWAPDAIAFESLPLSRLTMRYQFRRSADYTATAFRDKFRSKPTRTWLRVPASMCLRIAALAYHAIALPFATGHSLVRIAWNAGALVGIVRALFGGHSNHYMNIAGD